MDFDEHDENEPLELDGVIPDPDLELEKGEAADGFRPVDPITGLPLPADDIADTDDEEDIVVNEF